jgi:hypothetical protein
MFNYISIYIKYKIILNNLNIIMPNKIEYDVNFTYQYILNVKWCNPALTAGSRSTRTFFLSMARRVKAPPTPSGVSHPQSSRQSLLHVSGDRISRYREACDNVLVQSNTETPIPDVRPPVLLSVSVGPVATRDLAISPCSFRLCKPRSAESRVLGISCHLSLRRSTAPINSGDHVLRSRRACNTRTHQPICAR